MLLRFSAPLLRFSLLAAGLVCAPLRSEADEAGELIEARVRARLLHELIHGALQVMHRDYFNEEDRDKIPSSSLEDVFKELEKTWKVNVAWMAVNAKPMSTDHKPKDQFQKAAAEAITDGADSHDVLEGDTFRYAGAIVLGNRCLKCHVPDRTSLEERKAAVLITMPLNISDRP